MRNAPSVLAVLALLLISSVAAQDGLDCFAVVAGKGCTADGSVLFAHNEDDGGNAVLHHWKMDRARHPEGATVRLHGGGTVPEVAETFGYLWSQMPGYHFSDAYLNEHGVALASNACGSREDHPALKSKGIGFMLRRLVAQRARSARHGVEIAASLLDEFGYAASGRILTIADSKEAWLICLVKGKHYVAARVPDDRVVVIPNTYVIHRVDPDDRANFRVSAGLIDYAKERGWYDPEKDGAFDFAMAYALPGARLNERNYRRQWRAINLLAKEPVDENWHLPDFFAPKRKLTPADLMAVLRDHYEETDYDLTDGYRKGSPNRTAERTICTTATQNAVVFQLRANLPVEVGALMWIAMRRPDGSVFLPWYLGMRDAPPGFSHGDPARAFADHFEPIAKENGNPPAFRVFADLCARLGAAYGERFPAVKRMRDDLEGGFFRLQPKVERLTAWLMKTDRDEGLDFLTAYVFGQTVRAVQKAEALSRSFEQTP